MKFVKTQFRLKTLHRVTHIEQWSGYVEAVEAKGTGLAYIPFLEEWPEGATFAKCPQWTLAHIESGLTVGQPFEANKAFAETFVAELCKTLDFTQTREYFQRHPSVKAVKEIQTRIEERFRYQQATLF